MATTLEELVGLLDLGEFDSQGLALKEAVFPEYSRGAVKRAGRLLRQERLDASPEVIEAFRVAHNWVNAHALPMSRMRHELMFLGKQVTRKRLSSARPKRMASVRAKLRNGNNSLDEIQDLGGCRLILPTISDVDRLTASYQAGNGRHELARAYHYIGQPKRGGYRSNHLAMRFCGRDELAPFDRLRIELQIRTQLQHAWATAVEAVGMVRRENLKGGEGCPDWLRLFALMSGEFAAAEDSAPVPGVSELERERREEIRELTARLNALDELAAYAQMVRQGGRVKGSSAKYYRIAYNRATQQVSVTPGLFSTLSDTDLDGGDVNAVIVEVESAQDLARAYPNYFMDVEVFLRRLEQAAERRSKPTKAPSLWEMAFRRRPDV